jgi:hypothetical protein
MQPRKLLDNAYALRFAFILSQPWENMDAFRLGIIDSSGKALKRLSELKTDEEKSAYTRLHVVAFKIKRLLEKLPAGDTALVRFGAALALLKEESQQFQAIGQAGLLEHLELNKYYVIHEGHLLMKENFVGGCDMADGGLLKTKKDDDAVEKVLESSPEENVEVFASDVVFTCDDESFHKSRLGKVPYARYKTYVGEDEVGEKIRQYGRTYPDKNIILKNRNTGAMLYFKRKG